MNSEKQKVLIVDDEPRNQRIAVETLDGLVDFRLAASGEDALKQIEEYRPDLVLLDIMMPGLSGYEVCQQIRKTPHLVSTRIILVSGKAMLEERLKGYEVGADDYMSKPFVPEELLAKSNVFLKLAKAEKDLASLNRDLESQVEQRTMQLMSAEAKLMSTAKMAALGEMAGGVAHEINTPLGTIKLITDLLADSIANEPFEPNKALEKIGIIDKTVSRISSIVLGLRTFSRDGSNDVLDSSNLNQIIEGTLDLCREKLKASGIMLKYQNQNKDLMIACRPVEISQVILNLINNSCDAIEGSSDKWIEIAIEESDDKVKVSVSDSGSGISEAAKLKLFQPFFTTKEIGKGTGLGLSISKGIMNSHNGSLTLNTQSKHTCFVVELPKQLIVVKMAANL